MTSPSYLGLFESGELERRAGRARASLAACRLCPRECGVDRTADEVGFCRSGDRAGVASALPHFGEEPPITGSRGAGTIFFISCTLACRFCQNHQISQGQPSRGLSVEELARQMLDLQARGCHNLDLVTPTHFTPAILEALVHAVPRGLRLPLIWNTSGYERLDTLDLLDGVIDLYLPDLKYADEERAAELSSGKGYVGAAQAAIREMHRQVGDLEVDEKGVARRGLIVRHLVLPGGLSGTRRVLEFIAERVSPATAVSLMAQYYPAWQARRDPRIARRITAAEYAEALAWAEEAGLDHLFTQAPESYGVCRPDFEAAVPFDFEKAEPTPSTDPPRDGKGCRIPARRPLE